CVGFALATPFAETQGVPPNGFISMDFSLTGNLQHHAEAPFAAGIFFDAPGGPMALGFFEHLLVCQRGMKGMLPISLSPEAETREHGVCQTFFVDFGFAHIARVFSPIACHVTDAERADVV